MEDSSSRSHGSLGCWEDRGPGARLVLILISTLISHILGSLLKISLRKGNSYLFLKKRDASRYRIETEWNVFDKKLEYLNIIAIDSSVVCHFTICTVNVCGRFLCSLGIDMFSRFQKTGRPVFNSHHRAQLHMVSALGKSIKLYEPPFFHVKLGH